MTAPRTHFADDATLAYIAKLETELAAAQADADRYRWLRDQRLSANVNFAMTMGWEPRLLSAQEVDAAINASIANEAERG